VSAEDLRLRLQLCREERDAYRATVESAAEAALDATLALDAELHQARCRIAQLEHVLERAARCLVEPNPAITDTLWLDPSPRSLSPTLYEYLCLHLGREVSRG